MTVDYSLVTVAVTEALYDPYVLGQTLADIILQIEQGEATLLANTSQLLESNSELYSCDSGLPQPFSTGGQEILTAIGCGDIVDPIVTGLDESIAIYQDMLQISPSFGPVLFTETAGPCS